MRENLANGKKTLPNAEEVPVFCTASINAEWFKSKIAWVETFQLVRNVLQQGCSEYFQLIVC